MYWKIEVTPEEEDEIIMNIAQKIHKHGLDVAAIFMIESVKPLSYIGTQMGRFFLSPFLPALGEDVGVSGEKLFQVFEKRDNVENLIKAVEKLKREEEMKKEKAKEINGKNAEIDKVNVSKKKGWRSLIPFWRASEY